MKKRVSELVNTAETPWWTYTLTHRPDSTQLRQRDTTQFERARGENAERRHFADRLGNSLPL